MIASRSFSSCPGREAPLGPVCRVNTSDILQGQDSAVDSNPFGKYVVSWTRGNISIFTHGDGSVEGVFGQRFDFLDSGDLIFRDGFQVPDVCS